MLLVLFANLRAVPGVAAVAVRPRPIRLLAPILLGRIEFLVFLLAIPVSCLLMCKLEPKLGLYINV